jgi:anaerobic selenocysteine-containing dehydrogenase
MCDIALPVPTPFERNEAWVNLRPLEKIAPMPASIPPLWETKPDYSVIKDLLVKMGMGGAWTQWKDDLELAKWVAQPVNPSWEDHIKNGFLLQPLEYKRYEKGHLRTGRPPYADNKPGFKTPSGKVELWMSLFEGRPKNYTHSQIPTMQPLPEGYDETPELAKKFPILLTTGPRELNFPYFHSMLHHEPWLREIQQWPLVRIHPDTASQNGIQDGDWVWVETQWGKARFRAELYPGIHPKVVAVTHHWHYPEVASTPDNPRGAMYSSASLLTQWYGEGSGREALYHDISGNPTTRSGLLCRISRCAEGAPPGSGLDKLASMYKSGQGITW